MLPPKLKEIVHTKTHVVRSNERLTLTQQPKNDQKHYSMHNRDVQTFLSKGWIHECLAIRRPDAVWFMWYMHKKVAKMYCSAIITIKSHRFFIVLQHCLQLSVAAADKSTRVNKTGSNQCYCTAIHSQKPGAWKKCARYLASRIMARGAIVWPPIM